MKIKVLMLLAACAVMAKAHVSFDYSSGEPGCQTHLRLPKVEKDVKAILYCHQNMTEEVVKRSHYQIPEISSDKF